MTIQEYKQKADEYFGLTSTLQLVEDGRHSERWRLTYFSPTNVEIAFLDVVKSKIHKMPHGWYHVNGPDAFVPHFDPDTIKNHENFREHIKNLEAQGK